MKENTRTMNAPLNDRPRPLADAAKVWGRVVAGAGGVVSALVTAGALTAGQGSATVAAFSAVDGLVVASVVVVSAGSALLAAFGITRSAEPRVTPVADPVFETRGGELVELIPDRGAHRSDGA